MGAEDQAYARPSTDRRAAGSLARDVLRLAKDGVLETLWPTRCCVCDAPGAVVCDRCLREMAYVDRWQACPRCGAPYGRVQCTECNELTMAALERSRYPFDSCASAVVLDAAAHRTVLAWKDGGEARLGAVIARLVAKSLPPSWSARGASGAAAPPSGPSARLLLRADGAGAVPGAVFYVPASSQAVVRRGWDHAEQLAAELGSLLGLPSWTPLRRPSARDQRALGRRERARNARGAFTADAGCRGRTGNQRARGAQDGRLPRCVLLVDDVFTTGSTLSAATDALKEAGVETVHCATFARAF